MTPLEDENAGKGPLRASEGHLGVGRPRPRAARALALELVPVDGGEDLGDPIPEHERQRVTLHLERRNGRHPTRQGRTWSPAVVAKTERQALAVKLRREGKSYREIAEIVGYSTEFSARRAVKTVMDRVAAELREDASEALLLDLSRLDSILVVLGPKVEEGELGAIDRALKVLDQRAKLLGLYAPERRELSGPGGAALIPEGMTDDEVAARVKALLAAAGD